MISDDNSPPFRAITDPATPRPMVYSRFVRWLAVGYVLSLFAGPAGFFILGIIACAMQSRRDLDQTVITLYLAAMACPLTAAVYRIGFQRWGALHWPQEDSDHSSTSGPTT